MAIPNIKNLREDEKTDLLVLLLKEHAENEKMQKALTIALKREMKEDQRQKLVLVLRSGEGFGGGGGGGGGGDEGTPPASTPPRK